MALRRLFADHIVGFLSSFGQASKREAERKFGSSGNPVLTKAPLEAFDLAGLAFQKVPDFSLGVLN
jgi:hypothetical protein